jgi:hypothetical protein
MVQRSHLRVGMLPASDHYRRVDRAKAETTVEAGVAEYCQPSSRLVVLKRADVGDRGTPHHLAFTAIVGSSLNPPQNQKAIRG